MGLEQPASEQLKAAAHSASKAKAFVRRSQDIVVCKSHPAATMRRAVLPQLKALPSEPIKVKTVDESDGAGL